MVLLQKDVDENLYFPGRNLGKLESTEKIFLI